jgi:integrase
VLGEVLSQSVGVVCRGACGAGRREQRAARFGQRARCSADADDLLQLDPVESVEASEIADRIVRDLDGGGTKLLITRAKTEAGIRTMKIPTVLQPLLKELANGKQSSDRLFGEVDRMWVRRHVRRLCKMAGVPMVSPHGLRGTHGRLAVEAGISGDVVAASLGHESFAVTQEHFAGRDAAAGPKADRVAATLN